MLDHTEPLRTRGPLTWVAVTVAALFVLAGIGAAGVWVYGVASVSAPDDPAFVGIRIVDGKVSVKGPLCPYMKADEVRVHDSRTEELLWEATGPLTPEGVRGEVTLWRPEQFRKATGGPQPATLPKVLDISVADAERGGPGEVFDTAEVAAAQLPAGAYWTRKGPRTAQEIDAQYACTDPPPGGGS